jgi:formate hydrogenlyase subunit 3/multisubunit Na+/H+ antiporter MnhD subunit
MVPNRYGTGAQRGLAHAYAHILYKALLFMGAGAVLQMTGRSKLNELGGLYKYMPLSLIFYVVGGISISGFPLFSGFVSKSLIVAGAGEAHHNILMVLLLLVGGHFQTVGLKALFRLVRKTAPAQGTPQEYALGHGVDFPPLPVYRRLSPGPL